MRITLQTINRELAKRGHNSMLAKGGDYFYFWFGEATDWIDRTVRVPTVNSLTLDQWVEEFKKLKQKNRQIMASVTKPAKSQAGATKRSGRTRRK